MADSPTIENLLGQLLTPDNAVIQQATEKLKSIHADPNFIPSLCSVLTSSDNPQVRQYAAVLLRRKVIKRKQWSLLNEQLKTGLKDGVFQTLIAETQSPVKNSLAQLIGTLANHCDDLSEWPQLLQFLTNYVDSSSPQEKEVAMLVLKTVSAEAPDQLSPHLTTVLNICSKALYEPAATICYYSVMVLNNMVFEVSTDELDEFSALVPRLLEVVKLLSTHDEEQACECMEIFDSLVECEVAILHPHVKSIVQFCLEMAINEEMPNSLRVKSLECISWLVSMKKKAIQKMNLLQPILDAVFSLMCHCDDAEDDLEDSEETEKAASYAARIMDSLALHLPAEKIVTQVVRNSSQALLSTQASDRKAGYVALGIIAEGCSDHISNKYLHEFLERVITGFQDTHPGVRNGAMFALGQFSEHLQPGITKYAKEIIPLLMTYAVNTLQSPNPSLATLTRTYYALEAYVENLEKDVFPFLPDLMEHLMFILDNDEETELAIKLKELSFSCVASIAFAAKTNLNPYFEKLMKFFNKYLTDFEGEKVKEIQLQALETLGVLAKELDEESFTAEISNMCIQLGLTLIESFNDPDVRRCVYNLFSSLSTLKTADMVSRLPVIVNYMLQSLQATDGVKVHFSAEESAMFGNFNFDEVQENGDNGENGVMHEDDDEMAGITIESPYLDEKEDACQALSDLAIQYYEHFMPYVESCYQETMKLEEFGSVDVIKTSLKSLANLTIAVHDYHRKFEDEPSLTAMKAMLVELLPKYISTVMTDKERAISMTALQCIQELLENIGLPVLESEEDMFEKLITTVKSVLKGKTICQDCGDDDDIDDDEQAEYDTLLLEHAAGTLPLLAKLVGSQKFSPLLKDFMSHLLKKCKPSCSPTEKAYSLGTIAELFDSLDDGCAQPYLNQLIPILTRAVTDPDEELRNNAVFCVGLICSKSAGSAAHKYADFLQVFHGMAAKETVPGVRDNITAAVARILIVGHLQLPVSEVWKVLLEMCPLTYDLGEYSTVVDCFIDVMYAHHKQLVIDSLQQYLIIIGDAVKEGKLATEDEQKIGAICEDLKTTEPERLHTAITALPPDSPVWLLFPNGI